MLVPAIQQCESTLPKHTSAPSWASLPLPSHPLGHHRAPSWAPCLTEEVPSTYFTHGSVDMSVLLGRIERASSSYKEFLICLKSRNNTKPVIWCWSKLQRCWRLVRKSDLWEKLLGNTWAAGKLTACFTFVTWEQTEALTSEFHKKTAPAKRSVNTDSVASMSTWG